MRKLSLLAALLAVISAPAFAAGTLPGISMTQQLDELGKPLSGGKLSFIQAGTTSTPQNCYQDTALTLAWPNPLTLDAAGRVGQVFCADGVIKIRLTDKNGNQKLVQDNLLVVGPSGGGGGGGTVDPTTIFQTGAFMQFYGAGTLTGWVRCNGRTIGSASSGGTERSNADTQALFVYLWGADANLAVSGGRGASGAADFAANKTLTLPDCRARVLAGIDDMGSGASGRLSSTYFGTSPTVLGAVGGAEFTTLTLAQLPTGIATSGSNVVTVNNTNVGGFPLIPVAAGGTGPISQYAPPGTAGLGQVPYATNAGSASTGVWSGTTSMSGTNTVTATSTNTGGQAHRTVQPTILATTFIKL